MFGGQFLAQGLVAAQLTVTDDRDVNSLHAYFLRPGDVNLPTTWQVERVRDGRGFSSRSVVAQQAGKDLFRMALSFQVPRPGAEFSSRAMPDVPSAEKVTSTYNEFTESTRASGDGQWHGSVRPMDIRYINPPSAPAGEPILEPQLMWMRIKESLEDEPRIHDAALAYLSDASLIDHVALPHGRRWEEPGFDGTSLDHAMWFHRHVRADEWVLFDQKAEATASERGLATGRFFTEDGELIATCAQEGLMRWEED
jgi:acyl-CoA thioesterase-2